MDKNYKVYYEPEGEIFEIYHKCGDDFFKKAESYSFTLNMEIVENDLELGVIVSEGGKDLGMLVCDITKMSAYSPDLIQDIKRIPDSGKVKFSLRCEDKSIEKIFELDNDQIAFVKDFLEIE